MGVEAAYRACCQDIARLKGLTLRNRADQSSNRKYQFPYVSSLPHLSINGCGDVESPGDMACRDGNRSLFFMSARNHYYTSLKAIQSYTIGQYVSPDLPRKNCL